MAITRTTQIEQKIQEYKDHCLSALDQYADGNGTHCVQDIRKSCEALFKILIFAEYGDINGLRIILGEVDESLKPSNNIFLGYKQLFSISIYTRDFDKKFISAFKDIQKYGNDGSHNPNKQENEIEKIHVDLCRGLSHKLTEWLYVKLLSASVPSELQSAYNGNPIVKVIEKNQKEEWHDFYISVDEFSKHNKYILVSPPEFKGISELELKTISRINWSFIFDFNPESKNNGLFKAIEPEIKDKIIPITIEQMGLRNIVGEGNFKVNWLFANGLSTVPETITADYKSWRNKKYHKFIKELLSDFFSKTVQRYTIIYLYDKIDYIEEIVRIIAEFSEEKNDLFKHVFLYQRSEIQTKILEFEKYDVTIDTACLNPKEFLSGISSSVLGNVIQSKSIIVPARTNEENNTKKDLSSIYMTYLDNHIEIVHQNIDTDGVEAKNEIPDFYKGQRISWHDIATDIDVRRNKTNTIIEKIRHQLSTSKNSIKFELKHNPGAGGTTLARRIAFEIRNEYPTIIISQNIRTVTSKLLSDLAYNLQKPILAIVEAAQINHNQLEDLIRKCNAERRTIIFLYLTRTYSKIKDTELIGMLNANMLDLEERNRFISRYRFYATNKELINGFETKQPSECELIDFSLSLNIGEYNEKHILDYISGYIDKLSDSQVTFVKYVSIIYHYSQKSVSEMIFRNLYDKSLSYELKQTSIEKQYIRKLLLQENNLNNESIEYWKPRFSIFSELILTVIIGKNWKDNISIHVIELIKKCKENNPFLIDEVSVILKGVILERNNEDLLGVDEQWREITSNDQFSILLKDIAEKAKQKEVLQCLIDNYPNESHFLGHYARFLYEKAEEINDYDEAEKYINLAFLSGGENDSNLQHIAGMCQRRKIEFYYRDNKINEYDNSELQLEIIDLTNSANSYFNASRQIDPYNIHAYIAQIQTLIKVIDLGKELSGISNKELFITNSDYSWYAEQLSIVVQLIDEAKIVIDHIEAGGRSNSILKANTYLKHSEANTYELLGDYNSSISTFRTLSDTADRNLRPYFRSMYVHSILLKKVKGKNGELNKAWGMLNDSEIKDVESAINSNILQDSQNIQSLRLWFRFVRYSSVSISLDEIISKLKLWYDNSTNNYIANLECSYYLYILYASLSIRAGDSFSDYNVKEAQRYIGVCKEKSPNSKFPFEWYGKADGIKMLVNHKERVIDDYSNLQKVKGTIVSIYSKQQGKIKLASGLDVFFVPIVGNFNQNLDETSEVEFYIGFRHDGLMAWNVQRLGQSDKDIEKSNTTIVEFSDFQELIEIEKIEEIVEEPQIEFKEELFKTEIPKYEGPKVVGSIDLSKFDKGKKKQ